MLHFPIPQRYMGTVASAKLQLTANQVTCVPSQDTGPVLASQDSQKSPLARQAPGVTLATIWVTCVSSQDAGAGLIHRSWSRSPVALQVVLHCVNWTTGILTAPRGDDRALSQLVVVFFCPSDAPPAAVKKECWTNKGSLLQSQQGTEKGETLARAVQIIFFCTKKKKTPRNCGACVAGQLANHALTVIYRSAHDAVVCLPRSQFCHYMYILLHLPMQWHPCCSH